jgi:tRNA pseudouridine65 synthase
MRASAGADRASAIEVLTILYRDEHLVAVDKPAGLLVHRSDIDRSETRFAVQLVRDLIGRRVRPVHRLDKGTSGVLLFALDDDAARGLGGAFERAEVEKAYLAVVRGWPPATGTIDHALARVRDGYAPGRESTGALPARTDYHRLATVELPDAVDRYPTARYALLALAPRTGRRHQLRRHLKHIAHPIIGDATYGKGVHNRYFRRRYGAARLLLACVGLSCRHPVTGAPLSIAAPPGDEFAAVLAELGWARAAAGAVASWPVPPAGMVTAPD